MKQNMEQSYGRANLSESEHALAETEIRKFCQEHKLRFFYYRTLRYGYNKPTWREFKIEGPSDLLKKFDDEFCTVKIVDDSWRKNR